MIPKREDIMQAPPSKRVRGRPPEEYENPPGVGKDTCDTQDADADVLPCDTPIEDEVMEESKPGVGIEGYEGEEVGGT